MKSTEERIKDLEKELQVLKEECKRGAEFSEGDWVKVKHFGNHFMCKIKTYIPNGLSEMCYGFNASGNWINEGRAKVDSRMDKATPDEVEKALRKEWAKRCKEAGWDDYNGAEIEDHAVKDYEGIDVNSGRFTPVYDKNSDYLWTQNGAVYAKGKWATPKKNAKMFFDWYVTEGGEKIGIGCKYYDPEFLSDVYWALAELPPNKTVADVIEEIGKLDF